MMYLVKRPMMKAVKKLLNVTVSIGGPEGRIYCLDWRDIFHSKNTYFLQTQIMAEQVVG